MFLKFKAKLVDKSDKWVFFDLNTISKMHWHDGTFWREIDESTICQMLGTDNKGNEFYTNDFVDSFMTGDYDPMIKKGRIAYEEYDSRYVCIYDYKGNDNYAELDDFAFEVTGENYFD